MMRIAALNDESSDESEEEDVPTVTKEAQEEQSLSKYKESLEMIRDGRNKEAEDILLELLGTKLLQEVEKTTGAMQVPASLSLKYSCLKNIGMLALKRDDDSAALDYFLRAVQLDDTDVSLWFRMGCVAEKLDKYNLAATSFLEGLRCSPSHWPCLDHLVTILFALDDYMTCLLYVSRGLRRDPQFTKGLVLRDEMLRETPFLKDIYKDMHNRDPLPMDGTPDADVAKEILQEAVEIRKRWFEAGKSKPLEPLGLSTTLEFTWQALGEELLNLYHFAQVTDEPFTICNPVNLNVVRPKSTTTSPQGKAQTEKQQHDQNNTEGGGDNEAGKGKNGGRRRMFLESWVLGGQRRSARVRSTVRRDNDDTSLGETLRRIIPLSLLPESSKEGIRSSEDSMDTMDMFKLFERQEGDPASITTRRTSNNSQADVDEAIKREEYFGTDKETEDVKKFVADNQVNCGVSLLIVAYTQSLSGKQSLTWPTKLIPVFLDCYELMRKCAPHTNPFCDEFEPDEYKSDGEITLHSCEMFVDRQPPRKRNTADSNENSIPLRIVEDVTHLIFLSGRKHLFKNDFELRVYWLRSHVAIQKNDPQDALYCLNQVLDCLVEFPEGVVIPNLRNNGLVTVEVVEKLQSTLENTRSLAGIEQLWEEQRWEELATILESSFQSQQASSEQQRTMEDLCRTTQIEMFLDALVRLENQFPRCFFWIEACLNEAFNKYLSMTDDEELQRKWAKVIEKLLTGFIYCIEENDIKIIGTLPSQRLSRMVQNLSHIICHQLETPESVIEMPIETVDPWILLQLILTYDEEKKRAHEDIASNASSEDSHKPSEIPGSLMVLFTAHEHLGKRSWCCLNEGALLLHSMEEIIPKLRSEAFAPFRSKLTPYVEQIIYCLYAYPNKKTKGRHLQEHSVPQLPLTFDRAQQLLEFYRPDELPEFDSYRLGSISADAEVLFKRILTLAPPESNPGNFIDDMKDYIFDLSPDLPKAKHTPLPPGVRDINYLLGDYYFKNSDLQKAIQYYLLDVCHNPNRLDSWAGMALARGSQLETQLNSCEAIDEVEFLKQASAAQRCYKRTLELDNFHGLIWIEFGSFVYMIHSFCSRLLKQESDRLSLEQFEMLEEKKEATLNTAEECFKQASQLWQDLGEESAQQDERWLHHYMLGKIVEKREDDPIEAITQYQKAAKFLFENNATYPSKISYTNPPEYAIEALEIHYRIHACILKFLESNEGKQIDEKNEKFFAKVIEIEKNGQFVLGKSKSDMQMSRKRKSSTESSNDSKRIHLETSSSNDVKNVVENMVVQVDKDNVTGSLMQGDEIQFPARITEHKGKGNERSSVETDKSVPKSPQRRASQESTTTITSTTTTTESSSSSSDSSSSSSSSSSSDSSDSSDTENDGKTAKSAEVAKQPEEVKSKPKVAEPKIDLNNLVQACLKALETCVIRFPEHYKALFRLAHYHFRSRAHRNVARCRDLLLGPDVPATNALHGLFQDRKPSNFFNGVWRIPINEIDRPGCFASHMSRCVLLTMDLVRELKDHNTLLDLCLQLRRIPEPDKKYLRDTEREQLSRQAVVLALQVLRSRFKELKPGDEKLPSLMVEVLRSLQKVQKQLPNREQAFSKLLTDCFAMYKFGKVDTDVNLTDPALKFAQSELARTKAQQAQAMANVALPTQSLASPSTSTAPTTLPTPPVSSVPARKEKSSGTSRRGRPPLSRPSVPRMSNPMNFSPNLSTVGSTGRGRPRGRSSAQPFSYMPNLLSDPSYLTAAMQSSVPSLDVAMTYLNFKAQMEAQFMQQMLGNTAANFPNFTPTSLPSFPQLPSMSPYTSTAQQIAKDRPNLSVTAINPVPSTSSKPGPKPGSKKTPKEVPRQPRPQFPVKLSVPTKAKLKAKIPTPPMRASPVPRASNSPIPSQARRPSPGPTKRQSPIPSQVRRNSPIPPKRNSPVPQMQRSSPLPTSVKSSAVQRSSPVPGGSTQSPIPPMVRRQSPIPPVARRQSPIPPMVRRQSPIPPVARRQSPIPPMVRRQSPIPPMVRRQSPIPPMVRRQSPIPPVVRRQSPIPPAVRRQSPIPPSGPPAKKSSSISPVRHIANPAPSTMTSMIPRGPPGLSHRPQSSYISPPQAHMNPTLERIGREVTVTASVSKHPRVEAPKSMSLPLNLPSSITITPKSHHRAVAPPGRDEISIQQLPPATITRAEPKVSPPKPDKPKTGPGVEIITLE